MLKLTPRMEQLYAIAKHEGFIDPIVHCGPRDTASITGLVTRGLIRPHRNRGAVFFLATTPEQTEGEAYAEDERRTAEQRAHAVDSGQWVQADEGGTVLHVRTSRQGYPIEVEQAGHRFWNIRINGRTVASAGGTFEEARRAADRHEVGQVWEAAHEEYREVTRAARKADADAYQAELAARVKPLQADAACPAGHVAVLTNGGTCAECEQPAAPQPRTAVTTNGGWVRPVRSALQGVHAFSRDILAGSTVGACGNPGSIRSGDPAVITCVECLRLLAQRAQTIEQAEAGIAALKPEPRTPAEARTGTSDVVAAALNDVATLRALTSATAAPDGEAYAARNRAMAALDRIERALRGGA